MLQAIISIVILGGVIAIIITSIINIKEGIKEVKNKKNKKGE